MGMVARELCGIRSVTVVMQRDLRESKCGVVNSEIRMDLETRDEENVTKQKGCTRCDPFSCFYFRCDMRRPGSKDCLLLPGTRPFTKDTVKRWF